MIHRILAVHGFYQQRGGEDQVFENETALLESRGHEVYRHTVHNADVAKYGRLRLGLSTVWNSDSYREISRKLRDLKPDVMHIHNFLPLISPAAYYAARRCGVPVVQTLHNYRLLCPNALLYREGHICELCLPRTIKWPSVRHACYRDDRAANLAMVAMIAVHRAIGTWRRRIDAYIALSDFSRGKFISGGLPAERVFVKPNFMATVPSEAARDPSAIMNRALYVGRLSTEKGINFLIRSWAEADMPLDVIGDGPLMASLRAGAPDNVAFHGFLPPEQVRARMRTAAFLIFPSQCYENMSQVLVEAMALGLPIIAARMGASGKLITHERTGLLFAPGDRPELLRMVAWAWAHPEALKEMGARAQQVFRERYSEDASYRALISIYNFVTTGRRPSSAL